MPKLQITVKSKLKDEKAEAALDKAIAKVQKPKTGNAKSGVYLFETNDQTGLQSRLINGPLAGISYEIRQLT